MREAVTAGAIAKVLHESQRQMIARALKVLGPERLLFGTDSSFFPRGWHRAVYTQQRTALVSLGVPESQQSAIFAGNFERVFGAVVSEP